MANLRGNEQELHYSVHNFSINLKLLQNTKFILKLTYFQKENSMKALVSISDLPQVAIKPPLKQEESCPQLKCENRIKS